MTDNFADEGWEYAGDEPVLDRKVVVGSEESEWLPSEPEDDDILVWGTTATQNGKTVLSTDNGEPLDDAALVAYMDEDGFWPNVWWVNDRGDATLWTWGTV